MTRYGYHCSHEQFGPRDLLERVVEAEQAGFECATASDHFHPWSERQGQSGFVWSWLGAAMERTRLPFCTVSAPGYRYHPAILAQAGATLSAMYPDRLWMALGTGQRLNEAITGVAWPQKQERQALLKECVEVMRALWAGETVTHLGRIIVQEARLYTLPERPPLAIGAATTEGTARWLGAWADGLITLAGGPPEQTRRVIEAFREGGGEGKPVIAQAKLAWGPDQAELRADAFHQWGTNLISGQAVWEIPTPKQFEEVTALLGPEDLDQTVRVSTDLHQHAAWLREYSGAGVDELILHNVASNQAAFIEAFGGHVLPQLR
jgi:probable non-F420 flavinoid oxidoreductase